MSLIDESILDAKKYCTLYLVRHGETQWNVEHKILGQADKPLTQKGKDQAAAVAVEFKNIPIRAIYSSDLIRAKQTAKIIALQHNLTVTAVRALREKSYGHLEGQYKQALDALFQKYTSLSREESLQYRIAPGAETDEEVSGRFLMYLREISLANMHKTVVVISHRAMIRILLIHLGFGSYATLDSGFMENAGYIKILCDGIDFFLVQTKGVHKKEHI